MTVIYTLSDPKTKEVRYIGKTNKILKRRLECHISETVHNWCTSYRNNWIKGLLKKGLIPEIEVLEEVDKNDWQVHEIYWISQFKAWGFNLVNRTDGGDGNNNQIFSEESKRKRSAWRIGKKLSPETRAKISKAHKGKVVKPETREKLRLINIGKVYGPDKYKKRWKPVQLIDINGNVIKEYEYLRQAAEEFKCSPGQIANVCTGRTKSACGLRFRYKIV